MAHYKNFRTVVYCVASWADTVTENELEEQIAFFQKYVGIDKVYLEPYRARKVSREQLALCKRKFKEAGIEASGGITSVVDNLSKEDTKRQRIFNTYCFSNEAMREQFKEMIEYTASEFDEFIIDDFYFTQCMCEDCQREKGSRSWEEFRLDKMAEVSRNLVITPAKSINPDVNIIIKYPNWRESYQETGYNPEVQRSMFDMIYTGTETRHPSQTDQHLPRYLSYSLMRYMENVAPERNGGGWFDPYECYPIDTYLEQAYLTAFSRPKELMMFCWPSLYKNKVAAPLGLQLELLDQILSEAGKPVGLPVYLPFNSQGEDLLEDYLGMIGIPMEPTPDFPQSGTVFLTLSALKDKDIIAKLKCFVNNGGKAIVTAGFMREALHNSTLAASEADIKDMTSIRDRGRRILADEYHVSFIGQLYGNEHVTGEKLSYSVLDHRNNASWSYLNIGNGDQHASIMLKDTYGKGCLMTITFPDLFSEIKKMPRAALNKLRYEMLGEGFVYIDAPPQVSLFTYDNDTFGIYTYTADGCMVGRIRIHVRRDADALISILGNNEFKPLYKTENETVFEVKTEPGVFSFFKVRTPECV